MEAEAIPTLHACAGGSDALEALFRRFYEHVRADPLLSPIFKSAAKAGRFADSSSDIQALCPTVDRAAAGIGVLGQEPDFCHDVDALVAEAQYER